MLRIPISTSNDAHSSSSRPNQIDLTQLKTPADIRSLQTCDPFMYHSIPAVHKAQLSIKEVDYESVLLPSTLSPSSVHQDQVNVQGSHDGSSKRASTIVPRRSRVTTECHMSILMEELLLSDDDYLQNDIDIGDAFFDALFSNSNPQEEDDDVESDVAQQHDLIGILTGRRHGAANTNNARATSSVEEEELYELAQ